MFVFPKTLYLVDGVVSAEDPDESHHSGREVQKLPGPDRDRERDRLLFYTC